MSDVEKASLFLYTKETEKVSFLFYKTNFKMTMKKILTLIILILTLTTPKVFAADAWALAAEALGVYATYRSTLVSLLAMGNNVNAQFAVKRQDENENGVDKNPHDIEVVNEIMTRLINNSEYELRVNSLPFIWSVNNSEKFNAACYPMNYISVNKGLLRVLNGDENKIAAVLAHEMTHGIEQHAAKNYAQAMAQSMGAMILAANIGDNAYIDWSKFSGMVGYAVAKNITLPSEHDADEGGFYLMTSAGFNPGGGAAAMARMAYYVRYETRDIWEFDPHDTPNEQTFSDHPDTEVREEKLSKMMTDYSMGHVKVEKVEHAYKVFIDDAEIFTADVAGEIYKSADKAYSFAGGLAKAFHDFKNVDAWNFRQGAANHTDFLTDDKVFVQLREIAFAQNIGEKIRAAVTSAYENEPADARKKYLDAEIKRKNYWQKVKSKALDADKKAAKKLRVNADAYNDYGRGDLAIIEIERAFQVKKQDDIAECFAIRGRAKAINGDYDDALSDADTAVSKDPNNLYNFLNRADVRRMRGERELALADVATAIKLDEKNFISYKLQGDIFDEAGNFDSALESYTICYKLNKRPRQIPMKYLEEIDPAAYEKIREEENKTDEKNLEVEEKFF